MQTADYAALREHAEKLSDCIVDLLRLRSGPATSEEWSTAFTLAGNALHEYIMFDQWVGD